MLATLAVPYADTHAEQLVWTLDYPPVPALADTIVKLDENTYVELRVLGASHQVLLTGEDGTDVDLVETVACLPDTQPHLPRSAERLGGRYRLHTDVEHLNDGDLTSRVHGIRQAASGEPSLLAEFPGQPGAVTALRASSTHRAVAWRTWHVYPNHGQIVTTYTEVLR